jgi:hypothetical protein
VPCSLAKVGVDYCQNNQRKQKLYREQNMKESHEENKAILQQNAISAWCHKRHDNLIILDDRPLGLHINCLTSVSSPKEANRIEATPHHRLQWTLGAMSRPSHGSLYGAGPRRPGEDGLQPVVVSRGEQGSRKSCHSRAVDRDAKAVVGVWILQQTRKSNSCDFIELPSPDSRDKGGLKKCRAAQSRCRVVPPSL